MKKAFDGTNYVYKLKADYSAVHAITNVPNTCTFPSNYSFVNEGGHIDVQALYLSKRDIKHVHSIVNP